MTGSDWSNQGRTSPNGTDEYKTTESQSQGVIAPKCNFMDAMLSTTRLTSSVSKMFPMCFSDMFYPIFLPYYKNMTVLINYNILLTPGTLACHYSKTTRDIKFRCSVFILGSQGTTFEKSFFFCLPSCF